MQRFRDDKGGGARGSIPLEGIAVEESIADGVAEEFEVVEAFEVVKGMDVGERIADVTGAWACFGSHDDRLSI